MNTIDQVPQTGNGMKPATPRLLYPSLIVAAATVSAFSLLGIASITGHLPSANAKDDPAVGSTRAAGASSSAASGVRHGGPQKLADARPAGARVAAGACVDCGVIESIHAKEVKGNGSGVGAVLGGVAGALVGNQFGGGNGRTAMTLIGGGAGAYAGNEIEKNTRKQVLWETTVRMEDGSLRKLTSSTQPGLAVGARVKVTNGQVVVRT